MYRGADEYETKWVGYGDDGACTDPQLLWESVVIKLEDMVSYVRFQYYPGGKEEKYTIDQMQNIVFTLDSDDGRCFSLIPPSEMIKQGIRSVKIGFVSLSKISIHAPGAYEYEFDKQGVITNKLDGKKSYYMVVHELYEMLDDKSEPCIEDPKYKKDYCAQDKIEKFIMKEYGCTPPFVKNKEKICTNETIAKQVMEYWDSMKYETNCPDRCKEILIRAMWMRNKLTKNNSSQLNLYFPDRVKVVKSYYAYSGLSLIAEIGGYIGLFLGVSINQITYLIPFIEEMVQKYL